jgi:predicted nucleic acid-binding protein
MFLLDTNVVSELRKPRPHGAVLAWYRSHPETFFFLPSVALYELQAGVEVTRLQDTSKANEIEQWIDALTESMTVLALDARSARETARFMHGKSSDLTEDAMIAAIAITNGLTVATRNTKDFVHFGIAVVNPFLFKQT